MIDRILAFSIRNRWLVIVAVARPSRRSAPGTSRACRSTPCPTSPTSRCRSTPRRRAIRRSKSSSASPSRSRPRWPACRSSTTRARCRATACRRSPSSSRTAPTSTSRASSSTSASSRRRTSCPPGIETAMGPIATGPRRDLHVRRRGQAGREEAGRRALHADRPARRSRTGSSSRSCAPCPASSRSTPSAASSSSSMCCPIRRG